MMCSRSQLACAALLVSAGCDLVIGIDSRAEVAASAISSSAASEGAGASATTTASVGGSGGGCPSDGGSTGCDGMDAYSDVILADAPLAYWRLNETMGPQVADSSCGMMNPALFHDGASGEPLVLQAPGVLEYDKAIEFPGEQNQHISAASNFDFTEGESFSLEAWVNPVYHDGFNRRIFDKHEYGPPRQGYFLSFAIDGVIFDRWVDDQRQGVTSNVLLELGAWSHLVGTYDAAAQTTCLYINARAWCTSTALPGSASTSADFRIGATSLGSTGPEGTLDELAVYGYALTAQQVYEHCTAANAVDCQEPSDPCP